MKATIIVLCLFLAAGAEAQSDAKLKAIRDGREAVTKERAVASGLRSAEPPPQGSAESATTGQGAPAEKPITKTPRTE